MPTIENLFTVPKDKEILAAKLANLLDTSEIASSVLDTDDVFVGCDLGNSFRFHVNTGAARAVVDDHWKVDGISNSLEVGNKGSLRGLDVVRGDDKSCIGSAVFSVLGEFDDLVGLDRAGTNDDGKGTIDNLYSGFDNVRSLFEGNH